MKAKDNLSALFRTPRVHFLLICDFSQSRDGGCWRNPVTAFFSLIYTYQRERVSRVSLPRAGNWEVSRRSCLGGRLAPMDLAAGWLLSLALEGEKASHSSWGLPSLLGFSPLLPLYDLFHLQILLRTCYPPVHQFPGPPVRS